jgi:chromosome segregation ATPase
VSAFFSKNDDQYKSQYEKFSSLLSDLKAQVEEAENTNKGGEQPMDEFENKVVEPEVVEEPAAEPVEDFSAPQEENESTIEESAVEEPSEFEQLQNRFNELETNYNELQTKYNTLEQEFGSFREASDQQMDSLRTENEQLKTSIQSYEAEAAKVIAEKKEQLVDKYSNILGAEEIDDVRANITNFSYEELESKLAISFANKQISGSKTEMVPLPEPEESTFASIMKNYKK